MTSRILSDKSEGDPSLPFWPVYVAMREVMTRSKAPLTLEQVVDGVVSLVLTAAINIHLTFKENAKSEDSVPTIESIVQVICLQAMKAAPDAAGELASHFGVGEQKQ